MTPDEPVALFIARQRLGVDHPENWSIAREVERYGYLVSIEGVEVFVDDASIRQHNAPKNPVAMPVSGPTVDGTKVTRDTGER